MSDRARPFHGAESGSSDRARLFFGLNAAAVALITAAALYAMHAAGYDFAGDDAFISFVYAENLATGHGLVFNPGERVWGYTSPLQALLLSVLSLAGADLVWVAPRLSLLWVALTSIVVFQIVRRFLGDPRALLVSLYLATAQSSVSALETKLLVLLQCTFLLLLLAERARGAAFVGALACLTRPDAVLLVVPALLLTREGRRPASLALFAVPGLLWVGFTLAYYGDIFPNSLHAKQGLTPFLSFLQHQLFHFTNLGLARPGFAAAAAAIAVAAGLALDPRLRATRPLAYALLLYPWVLATGYSLIGSIKSHDWEVYSGLFFFQLGVLMGLFTLLRAAGERWPRVRRPGFALVAPLLLALCFVRAEFFFDSFEGAKHHVRMGVRHRAYQEIARWLNLNVPMSSSLSVLEVGTLGYYTNLHMIDVAGIVTRGHEPRERMDHGSFARRFEPDYMLVEGDVEGLRVTRKLLYRRVHFFRSQGGFLPFSLLRRS